MRNEVTKTYTDQYAFQADCVEIFNNFKYVCFEHGGKYYKLEQHKDYHGKIFYLLLATTNKSYIGGYVVGCNQDLTEIVSKYIICKNIPLKITQ